MFDYEGLWLQNVYYLLHHFYAIQLLTKHTSSRIKSQHMSLYHLVRTG